MAILYVDSGYMADNYTLDDIYIDWANRIIHVPKVVMTLIQSVPTTIYQLDLNDFRLKLKDLEDDFTGMAYVDTHSHNTSVTVGGVELARVIQIINDHTVTFEDDQYAVNLTGANSNVGDVVNVNQVSVRSANSAGLVSSQAIEYGEYSDGVHIDVVNGVPGTVYPIGTLRRPSNNVPDAILIAQSRGFNELHFIGNGILDTGDNVEGYILLGENAEKTTITINDGAETLGCEIREATVIGNLDGGSILRNCVISNLNYINGFIFQCMLFPGTISLGGTTSAYFMNCYSGDADNPPIIDMNGTTNDQNTPLIMHNFSGSVKIVQKTDNGTAALGVNNGEVIIDSTCTNGKISISGNAKIKDELGNHMNSGTYNGSLLLDNDAIHGDHIHDMWAEMGLDVDTPSSGNLAKQIWDALLADHNVTNSFGNFIQKKVLTVAKFLGLK